MTSASRRVEGIGGEQAAVRAAGVGLQMPARTRPSTAVKLISVGVDAGQRGRRGRRASAIMLCTRRNAHTSWRARVSDWPRSTRLARAASSSDGSSAISTCHRSAYRAAISAAGNSAWSSSVVSSRMTEVLTRPLAVRVTMVNWTRRAMVSGQAGRGLVARARGAAGAHPVRFVQHDQLRAVRQGPDRLERDGFRAVLDAPAQVRAGARRSGSTGPWRRTPGRRG